MAVFLGRKGISVSNILRKLTPPLAMFIMLAACTGLRSTPTPTPTASEIPNVQCAWNWATQALPDLSTRLEAGLQAAGLKDVKARVEAYGENCITATGKVNGFAALETDFHIAVQVGSLNDMDDLGSLLEKILVVLDGFPTGSTPGPNPGYVGVTFQKGNEELNLWFPIKTGTSARAQGYHGARLFEELQKK
jgi:hypothetical protein